MAVRERRGTGGRGTAGAYWRRRGASRRWSAAPAVRPGTCRAGRRSGRPACRPRSPSPAAARPASRARGGGALSSAMARSSASRSRRETSLSISAWVASANGRLEKAAPPPPRNDDPPSGYPIGPSVLDRPNSLTILTARSVAPARSLDGPGRPLADHHQLGGPAAEADGERIEQVVLAVHVPLDQRQLLGHAEGLARGQDRHLGHRVGVLGQRRHHGVPGLVHRDRVLLLGQQHVGAFPPAEDDPVPGRVEVGRR